MSGREVFTPGEFVTVHRDDVSLRKRLLSGVFSKTLMARSLPQLNVDNRKNNMTFEIVVATPVGFFQNLMLYFNVLKRQDFILVFFPLILIMLKNFSADLLPEPLALMLVFFGLVSFVMSLRFRNQYLDHMRGVDRLSLSGSKNPLLRGQLRAYKMNRVSIVLLLFAVASVLPILYFNLALFVIVVPALLLGLYAQYFNVSAFKEKTAGEVLVFILFGPFLTSGLEMSLYGRVFGTTMWMGFILGMSTMFLLNLKVFSNIMYLTQLQSQNTLVKMGFDRAKLYLLLQWILTLGSFAVVGFVSAELGVALVALALVVLILIYYLRFFKSCQSPTGSEIQIFRARMTESVYLVYVLWLGIYLWQIFVRKMILL